jgi:hypothetical protein
MAEMVVRYHGVQTPKSTMRVDCGKPGTRLKKKKSQVISLSALT